MTDLNLKKIFIVTHGKKEAGANPPLTKKGIEQVEKLKPFLPKKITSIIVGTGLRHLQMLQALGIKKEEVFDFSPLVGNEISLEIQDGKVNFILSDGTSINPAQYHFFEKAIPSIHTLLKDLPHNSLICAGTKIMYMLKIPSPKQGCIYIITCDQEGISEIKAYNEK